MTGPQPSWLPGVARHEVLQETLPKKPGRIGACGRGRVGSQPKRAAEQLDKCSRLMMIDFLGRATASEDACAPVAIELGLFQNLKVLFQT
jgi:hypothetical protein